MAWRRFAHWLVAHTLIVAGIVVGYGWGVEGVRNITAFALCCGVVVQVILTALILEVVHVRPVPVVVGAVCVIVDLGIVGALIWFGSFVLGAAWILKLLLGVIARMPRSDIVEDLL